VAQQVVQVAADALALGQRREPQDFLVAASQSACSLMRWCRQRR
jgi:hypothetical protein